jgi:hypothetical protein
MRIHRVDRIADQRADNPTMDRKPFVCKDYSHRRITRRTRGIRRPPPSTDSKSPVYGMDDR